MPARVARCPNCGGFTPLPAATCSRCGQPLLDQDLAPAPPPPPPPELPVLGELTPGKAYATGVAAGLLPLGVAALVAGYSGVFVTGWALLLVLGIGAIVCLVKRRWRWLGYGLLTMAFISPVVGFVACLALLSNSSTVL